VDPEHLLEVLMRRGENPSEVLQRVHEAVDEINATKLPPGANMNVIYDRTELVSNTLATVAKTLLEGLVIVVLILLLFLRLNLCAAAKFSFSQTNYDKRLERLQQARVVIQHPPDRAAFKEVGVVDERRCKPIVQFSNCKRQVCL
jgi:hypothetical protein